MPAVLVDGSLCEEDHGDASPGQVEPAEEHVQQRGGAHDARHPSAWARGDQGGGAVAAAARQPPSTATMTGLAVQRAPTIPVTYPAATTIFSECAGDVIGNPNCPKGNDIGSQS